MIDIHSHILYGVDDGCKTIDNSIKLIEEAVENGFTDLILTPHYSLRRNFIVSYELIEERFKTLVEIVTRKEIKVNLHLGSEIDETESIFELLHDKKCHTMNQTNYVLVDFGTKKTEVDDICYELVINGYKPIVAHPERYPYIEGIELIKKWKKTGALIQINASSLFGSSESRKLAKLIIKNDLVDFIATDVHHSKNTYDEFFRAIKYTKKILGDESVERIIRINPAKILNVSEGNI